MVGHEVLLALVSLAAVGFIGWVAFYCASSLPRAWSDGQIRTGWAFGQTVSRQSAPLQFWWLFIRNAAGAPLCGGAALVLLLASVAKIVRDLGGAA